MIQSIALQRYRAFASEVEIELNPHTLLFGRNSAGKSALLRAIPLVAASGGPERPNRTGPLALEHPSAMDATYAELRSRLSPRNDLVIRLTWRAGLAPGVASIEYHLRDVQDLSRTGQVVERLELLDTSGWVSAQVQELFGHGLGIRSEVGEVSLVAQFAGGREAKLADVGSGVGQLVAVLAHLARAATGEASKHIITIEQPEAHLHADAEAVLGQIVAKTVSATSSLPDQERPRLVLETHSENILLALQLAILKDELAPDDIAAYWVSRSEDDSATAERIRFDEQARPHPPWPAGVFSESTDLAREILQERRRSS